VYAADNGAQIINNSWGRSGLYSQFEQDIINYAVSKGIIVVAAAGNTRKNETFFPAAYVHVIAVAAVNEVDAKASYSAYGKFVDLSAPGGDGNMGILSTFPVARGSYGELNGTSFASPIVAGIMGLLINRFPNFDQAELIRQIVLTSDHIDHLNPNFIGLLGNGRANAFRALITEQELLKEQLAKIEFFKAAIYDSIWGNGNFLLERDEEIGVDAWYRNYAVSPGHDLTITLATDDPDIAITDGQAVVGFVPPDAIFKIEKQLRFKISPQAMPHVAKLALNYSIGNNSDVDTIVTVIGKSSVLLVDDDNGVRNLEEFYTTILDQLGVPYLRWDHVQLGTPPAQALAQFPMIIWFCEWAFPSLSPDDRIALQAYLGQGGSLFLSGQDIGWDLADPSGGGDNQYSESAANFYREDLHSIYRADITGSAKVIGIPGSIGQGLSFDIYQPKIAHHYQFPDWIEAPPEAQLIFKYNNEKGGGIAFNGNSSVINLGFGFEAIDSKYEEIPTHFSKTRTEFMRRVLDNLGPIRHLQISDSDVPIDSLAIQVAISPLINNLTSLILFWKTETMPDYSGIAMKHVEGKIYQQTIALNAYLGQVQYYFKMETPFFEIAHPVSSPAKSYSIYIGVDRVAPEIDHTPLPDIFIQNTGRLIEAFVKDNIGVDKKSVWLHYSSAATKDSVNMTPAESNWYQAFMPPIIKQGDSVRYYFSASDQAANANRAVSDIFSYQTGIESFELGLDFWIADSFSWQIDDKDFHTGRSCISTFPGKAYPNNQNVSIRSRFGLRRRDLKDALLYLWTRYELEESKDFGFIEVSLDHGENWMGIGDAITGIEKNWIKKCYDLGAFYHESNDTLLLRFRLQTD
ncbi:S8 family serine peptidase, partial [candidate division KSB1 bacterium]|nr:S8 family serine peptidase [candidate division KSB1 bacterium]